jgi:hypothetical protein
MTPGKELNIMVAERVLGKSAQRPVRDYSNSIEAAWEVATQMNITLIPIDDGSWFAMVAPEGGFRSPQAFIECMQKGEFADSGAAVTKSAPLSICIAAINAVSKREIDQSTHDLSRLN